MSARVLTQEQLDAVLAEPREPGKRIGRLLAERGYVSEAQLTQALSMQLSIPWVSLYHIEFSRQLLNTVPRELAERGCLVPIFVRRKKGGEETLYVAMDDPTNDELLADVAKSAGLPVRAMIASESEIRSAIRVYYASDPMAETPPPSAPATARIAQSVAAAPAPPPPPPPRPTVPDPEVEVTSVREVTIPPRKPSSAPPPPSEGALARRRSRPRMLALTLLDGTTVELPARKKRPSDPAPAPPIADQLTARDLVAALRAAAQATPQSAAETSAVLKEVLGDAPRWEPVVGALLSLLLRKGAIADWEFVDELRKMSR